MIDTFEDNSKIIQLKHFVIAPIVEEIIYRGIVLNLFLENTTLSPTVCVLFTPLFFALSHLHHLYKARHEEESIFQRELQTRLFQASFTTLFGMYSGMIYLKADRNLLAPIILHSYCNIIQVPRLGICFDSHTDPILRNLIGGSYLTGIVLFIFSA